MYKRIILEMDCREERVNIRKEVGRPLPYRKMRVMQSIFFQTHMTLRLPDLRGKFFASSKEGSSLLAVSGNIYIMPCFCLTLTNLAAARFCITSFRLDCEPRQG